MRWTAIPATRFAQEAPRWHTLHRRCGGHALLAADLVAPLLAHFGTGRELLAWCEHGGRTVAMALVAPAGRGSWTTFQPAQAPMALWLQEPHAALEPLCHALLRALPGFPLVFAITQLDPAYVPRPAATPGLATLDYIDTARVTLDGTFEDYWDRRGKNLRVNLKKQRARLGKEGIATRLEVVRDPQAVARAVADYGRLESTGWKAGCGTAVHAGNAQGRYYRDMLEASCRRGAGSICRYLFDDRVVAMDLCVEDADSLVVLKTAYDESVAGGLSPTLLMREEACRRLFDEGRVRRLEFYGRVMEWHLRWTDEVRTMYHVNCYRWPGLRRLHTLLESRARSRAAAHHIP